ncbi:MAG: family transcriptional regulator [Paenibacillus sp.]|jgi:glucokinase-like ROK family protein|nr:family transcriptional regulator [Paenibacillus sp.]
MREMNRANILDTIRKQRSISQADLAKLLNLMPSTVLRIMKDLENEGYICQTGTGVTGPKGGRKASLWSLKGTGAFAIGVDLDAEQIVAVMLDLEGQLVGRVSSPSPSDQPSSVVMRTVAELVEKLIDSRKEYAGQIIGIGVGMPGRVDRVQGVSNYAINFADWQNVPVVQLLEQKFAIPVYIEGDMKLMALGEKWFGAGGDAQNLLCIGFRKGIGLGIVIHGEIYNGMKDTSGDIGHVVVEPNGKLCHCGRKGCLEAIASEVALLEWLEAYIHSNGTDALGGIIRSVEDVHMENVYASLQANNALIMGRLEESGRYLGRFLSDLVRIFDPEKIILGGKMIDASPVLLNSVRQTFEADQPNYATDVPEVLGSELSDNSIALGGAALVLSQLFRPMLKQEPSSLEEARPEQ